jgi:hypothetical protein
MGLDLFRDRWGTRFVHPPMTTIGMARDTDKTPTIDHGHRRLASIFSAAGATSTLGRPISDIVRTNAVLFSPDETGSAK